MLAKIQPRDDSAGFFLQIVFVGGVKEAMCDLKAFVRKDGQEVLLLESINQIRAENGEVTLRSIFGEEKKIRGDVLEISLVKNRLVVDQS